MEQQTHSFLSRDLRRRVAVYKFRLKNNRAEIYQGTSVYFNGVVSEAVLRDESVRFPLPRELQALRAVENVEIQLTD